uniref:MULE transposase domain-containing protein n=1 Tax=Tanacetum cinerariifolium TaxID=118510 RepID=A0A6L2JVX2_TANCI|nr:hypothetical protein CTI12_AA105810 [Tanacetum cinerariifolium]
MYYKIPNDPLTALKLLKNNEGLCDIVKAFYKNNLKIDLFIEHNGYDIMEMIDEELHPKKLVGHVDSDSNVKTNQPLDDEAHVVEQFEHENKGRFLLEVEDPDDEQNDHNKVLVFYGRDVSEGKCVYLKGNKPKAVDDDVHETSKHGSKKGDGRKVVNETLRKVVKERWNKKKEYEKKGSLNRVTILLGSTYELETEVNNEDGKLYFRRFYVCFHGVKQGWIEGCRKIIGLDGCFLTHTCKGQLLTTMGTYTNNQMLQIAWDVVGVENNHNWCWCISLIRDDLNLRDKGGINIISDGYKDVVATSMESVFVQKMKEIKMLDEKEHECLVERNPNLWCRAYFEMDRCSAAFKNGISESFNSRIVRARGKLIITMLDDVRVYIMQRMFCMNKWWTRF